MGHGPAPGGCTLGKLTEDQERRLSWSDRRFCEIYHGTGDIRAAAKAAGSKAKDLYVAGYAIKKKPHVRDYLDALRDETRDLVVTDTARRRDQMFELIDESITEARKGNVKVGKNGSVVTDPDGEPVREVNIAALQKAADLLGRATGSFTEVHLNKDEFESQTQEELDAALKASASDESVAEVLATVPAVQRQVSKLLASREAEEAEREDAEALH